jgi:dipeptidyl-peptidase-4
MRRSHILILSGFALAGHASLGAQTRPTSTAEPWISPAFPLELTSAKKADRVAWPTYERGMRNVWTAAAPDWRPVRVTRFLDDDGTDISGVRLSDDGTIVTFIRGHAANSQGWVANPSGDPRGAERAVWAARTTAPGTAWRVAQGTGPEVSPDGRWVLFARNGQIYRSSVTAQVRDRFPNDSIRPFINAWGTNSGPRWSPDGTRIAFTSERTDHSYIGLYDMRTNRVTYVAPGVDRDNAPLWSPDGKRIAFVRRPGLTFGQMQQQQQQQAQQGQGRGGRGGGGGGARGGGGGRGDAAGGGGRAAQPDLINVPGMYSSVLPGGHQWALMIYDFATDSLRLAWAPKQGERVFTALNSARWAADDHIVFTAQVPQDEWNRWFSLDLKNPTKDPVLLTPTNGEIEGSSAEHIALSKDGKTFYYVTNANDTEHRDVWHIPVSGGTPKQLTSGSGIETYPAPLASGKQVALLYADAKRPRSVALVAAGGGTAKVISSLPAAFPMDKHVVPQDIVLKAPDGLEYHNQLFLPRDYKPGEKRPALIFVHGGPARQMLLGYHYLHFYHIFYGINQWLADQGYVVMSVNFRSGIGYGRSFRQAPGTGARGNSEYQDVLTAGKYLQGRPEVDPKRVGIWGLSYGGQLTAEALARNSDIFIAGVDLAGVHQLGGSLDSASVAYKSSSISEIAKWKSPVLLLHGDDDRNVNFSQTVGLVQLLRAHNVYHELIVIPDDIHETLLHHRWISFFDRMDKFLKRFVWNAEQAPAATGRRP